MFRLIVFIVILGFIDPITSFGQSEIIPTISALIKSKDYAGAKAKLQEYGNEYPKSADVPMMAGNVVFRDFADNQPTVALNENGIESIFEPDVISMEDAPLILTDSVANIIAAFWHEALKLEPDRIDIHKGLCTVYSWALMEHEVERELAALRHSPGGDSIDVYTLAAYAKNMIDRYDFADGILLYRYLAAQYPLAASGLFSDIAGYYCNRDSSEIAMRYIDSALALPNHDEYVLNNSFQMHGWSLKFDRAKEDIQALALMQHNHKDLFFIALVDYVNGKERWRGEMKNYLKQSADSEQDERTLSGVLLDSTDDHRANLEASDSTSLTLYAILLSKRGILKYPNERIFPYRFALIEAQCGNYALAYDAMEKALTRNAAPDPADSVSAWDLLRAWVLQNTGHTKQAMPLWKTLISSKDNYASAAGCYFYSKELIAMNRNDEAKKTLDAATQGGNNKYVQMCKFLREGLN